MNILILSHCEANMSLLLRELSKSENPYLTTTNANTPKEAIKYVDEKEVDFLFIDIYFLSKCQNDEDIQHLYVTFSEIIILYGNWISYQDGDEKNGFAKFNSFLLKPLKEVNQLLKPVKKAEITVNESDIYKVNSSFFVKKNKSLIQFNLNDVICLESERNYITIYTSSENYLVRKTIQSLMDILPKNFIRVNRSNIINTTKVDKIVGNKVYFQNWRVLTPVISKNYRLKVIKDIPFF